MILLASDTSTKSLSVAVCKDGILIRGITEQTGMTHCQTYMPAVLRLLDESGLCFSDIDLYACTVGPGSYTGIRIGVSTTKTMAYAAKKGAIGVSTLETLAISRLDSKTLVCPLLDARNRRVFSSGYLSDELVIPEANRTIEELLGQIEKIIESSPVKPVNLIFCGDAASAYQEDPVVKDCLKPWIDGNLLNRISFIDAIPEAFDAAQIAYRKYCFSGMPAAAFDPFALEANYLSPSQAERMKKDKVDTIKKNKTEKTQKSGGEKDQKCEIRLAAYEDLQAIHELEQECFAIPWSIQSIETDLTRNREVATYLVATKNGKVAGYVGMWQVLDEAQITNLAVSKKYRGKGIGHRLIQELCLTAKEKGIARLTLEVRPSNTPARRVYEGAGFAEISKRKAYYQDNGEDAIIMLKNISTNPS